MLNSQKIAGAMQKRAQSIVETARPKKGLEGNFLNANVALRKKTRIFQRAFFRRASQCEVAAENWGGSVSDKIKITQTQQN